MTGGDGLGCERAFLASWDKESFHPELAHSVGQLDGEPSFANATRAKENPSDVLTILNPGDKLTK